MAIREAITIQGTVVANDKYDEISKRIVVADESGGIEVAIDMDNIESKIPLNSNIEIRVGGLYIGRQGKKCILGTKPTGEYVVDRLKESEIPLYIRFTDNKETVRAKRMKIAEIENRHLLHYVCIDDVEFIDEELGLEWCDCDSLNQYVESIRHITDGRDTLRVVCSAECEYASAQLPEGKLKMYGIVDYAQRDIALRITNNHSLSTSL